MRFCELMPRYLLLPVVFLAALSFDQARADTNSAGLSWERICHVDVCRATGHDGVMQARISPDGRHLAVTVHTPHEQGIFLYSMETRQARHWVDGSSPAWFADGDRITYEHGDDVWVIGLEWETPVRLTDDADDVRAPAPSPAGEAVAFYSERSGFQDIWLIAADGSDNEPVQLTEGSMPSAERRFGFAWSPDGSRIAYFSNKAEFWRDDLWLVDVDSGAEQPLSSGIMGRSRPAWSPDGSQLAVFATAESDFWYGDLSDVFLIDVDSGEERRLPMQVHAMDINQVTWSDEGTELFFPVHERGEIELWRAPAGGGVATRVTNMGGMVHDYDAASDDSGFIFVRSTPVRGREVDLHDFSGGSVQQLTGFATDWQGLVEPREIAFRSRDGLYIQAFLFTPPDFDPSVSYPSLVQVHGGGTNSYYNGLNLVEQRLAQRGYVVMAVNYRGGSGFGRAFQDLAVNDWANTQSLDAAAAARFIRSREWSNGKVGIYGYSYGGIVSLGAVTRAPKAFDAAVPMGGIYDFADAYDHADRLGRLFTREGHGGSPEARPGIYEISDSVARIEQVETPVLIMHGQEDARAPFRQYELVVEALERHDKEFESHSYPGEPHRFRDRENRVDMYRRLEAWMDRWVR